MKKVQFSLMLSLLILVLISIALVGCQTFNISIFVPTESIPTEGLRAATLPAQWTPTPIPEFLRPLESLTPQAFEGYTPGPEWDAPDLGPFVPETGFRLGQFVNFVKVVHDYLIVGDNSGTLTLFDLLDPGNPRPLVNIELGFEERILSLEPGDPFSPPEELIAAEVRDVEMENGWLYVITLRRLLIFDLTNVGDPRLIGSLELSPRLNALEVEGQYVRLLVSDIGRDQVRVVEIEAGDPARPKIRFEARLPGTGAGRASLVNDLGGVTNRTLEYAEQFKLYAFDDETNPIKLGEAYGAPAFRAWIVGDYGYISTARVGLDTSGSYITEVSSIWVVDLNNPEDPTSFAYIWTPDIATDFYHTEEYALAIGGDLTSAFGPVDESYWLIVTDMSDPQYPVVNRTLQFPGQPMGIDGTRGVTYVAAGKAGLQILWPEEGEALKLYEGEDFRAALSLWAGTGSIPTTSPTQMDPKGAIATVTALAQPYPTGTPTPGSIDQ